MKVTVRDDTRFRKLVRGLELMAEHRRRHPTTQSDALYYQLLADYFQGALNAREEGRLVTAITAMTPNELFHGLDLFPHPSPNRLGSQLMFIGWLYTGTPQGVQFFETVLAELKERQARGQGYVPQERFRLLAIFPPPAHNWKLLGWMEREHGAVVAADPYCSRWGDFEWDSSRPLLTLARKWMASPLNRQMHGPAELGWLPDTVGDAVAQKVDGALYWAHIGCKQSCSLIKIIRDALRERAGVPTLVLDIDVLDPSFVLEEELKDKLEGFFERLEAEC